MGKREVCQILESLADEDRSYHIAKVVMEGLKTAARDASDMTSVEKNEVIAAATRFANQALNDTARVQNLWQDLHCKDVR
jgi:hypothetical protein